MFEYDSVLDQYYEVSCDEFSDSSESEVNASGYKSNNALYIINNKRRRSKSRSNFINYNIPRILRKSGRLNIFPKKVPHKHISYIRDLGNTLLTIRWRWILLTLCLVHFASFLIFSCLWMMLAKASGDFQANATEFCVMNTHTFTGYFLLSIETITTIGFGTIYPTEACGSGGWVMLTCQAMLSIAIQGALIGAVYVKIAKPSITFSTSLFSKNAVICLRDGKLTFIFRILDSTRKIWCSTNISLYFIDKENTLSLDCFEIVKMNIEPYGLLIFPLEIEHVIDETSPLWTFNALDVLDKSFEIVAVAEGSSTITGQISQNRTSYINRDIRWGHRFRPCVDLNETTGKYMVDYKKFKQTAVFETPLCSAKKLQKHQKHLMTVSDDGSIITQEWI